MRGLWLLLLHQAAEFLSATCPPVPLALRLTTYPSATLKNEHLEELPASHTLPRCLEQRGPHWFHWCALGTCLQGLSIHTGCKPSSSGAGSCWPADARTRLAGLIAPRGLAARSWAWASQLLVPLSAKEISGLCSCTLQIPITENPLSGQAGISRGTVDWLRYIHGMAEWGPARQMLVISACSESEMPYLNTSGRFPFQKGQVLTFL